MAERMDANQLALVRGIEDTKTTLAEWNREPWKVLGPWIAWSVAVAVALLAAIWAIALLTQPDATPLLVPGINTAAGLADVGHLLYRNFLVLALHAMACVAGFMAGSSLPEIAKHQTGVSRWVHEKAGPLAIGFVVCATAFSLSTQAYVLGSSASTIAHEFDIAPGTLVLTLLPHALPELTALFLPLAAWVIASRQERWSELLAATVVTVAFALPVLVAAAFTEVYLTPHLIDWVISR
jgi:hypothetical protein